VSDDRCPRPDMPEPSGVVLGLAVIAAAYLAIGIFIGWLIWG